MGRRRPHKFLAKSLWGLGTLCLASGCGEALEPPQGTSLAAFVAGLPVTPLGYPPFYDLLFQKPENRTPTRHILFDAGHLPAFDSAALETDPGWVLQNLLGSATALVPKLPPPLSQPGVLGLPLPALSPILPLPPSLTLVEGAQGYAWTTLGQSLQPDGGVVSARRLTYRGLPLEGAFLKDETTQGNLVWAQASLPPWCLQADPSAWPAAPDFALNQIQALERAAIELNFHPWRLSLGGRSYLPADEGLIPTYIFIVDASGDSPGRGPAQPLRVLASGISGSVLEQKPLAFHAEGKAWLYSENSEASKSEGLVEKTLTELKGSGSSLEHDAFKVLNCQLTEPAVACLPTAKGPNYTNIAFDSPQYDELVAYYSVTRGMSWHKKIQAILSTTGGQAVESWGEKKATLGLDAANQLTVFVRALTRTQSGDTTKDNAQYLPGGRKGTGNPEILIGTGWEAGQGSQRTLTYLGRDADVTMHEFGHHIVFRNLKEVAGQSGSMHEGFADYFTYAITGNNLLGESIVAIGVSLRKGTIKGTVNNFMRAPAHKAGEFWSSALWDVREALGDWKDGFYKADKIIWDSIGLLKEDARYYDAIASIGKSAEGFAKATGDDPVALKEKIFRIFAERGFLEMPDGSGNLPAASSVLYAAGGITSVAPSQDTSTNVTADKEKSGPFGWCGVVASGQGGPGGSGTGGGSLKASSLVTLLSVLTAPLAGMLLARVRLRSRVRSRVRSQVCQKVKGE